MKKSKALRLALFDEITRPLPSPLRAQLLRDETFISRMGITPKFSFSLDDSTSVEISSLHEALRAAIAGRKTAPLVSDKRGRFEVRLGRGKNGEATIEFSGKGFRFEDADLLSVSPTIRQKALKRVLAAMPLMDSEETYWKSAVKAAPLSDRAYFDLKTALGGIPESLRQELQKPQALDVGNLMPDAPEYYRRLIAPLGNSKDPKDFIDNELFGARRSLLRRQPRIALRRIAYSGLWQRLVPFELLASLKAADASFLLDVEDPFSLVFCFELCCKLFPRDAGFVDLGTSVLEKLLNPDANLRRCHVYSALAMISGATLRRVAKTPNAPVYWVRLAALTHAGVLTDALYQGVDDAKAFFEWSMQRFFQSYHWHGRVDLREAPRWRPEWINPDHLHAELLGRINGALQGIASGERPQSWVSAIEGALTELFEAGKGPLAFFPGPFDDFDGRPGPDPVPEAFEGVVTQMQSAASFRDMAALFALAYTIRLPEGVLADVERLLDRAPDEPLVEDHERPFLHLCAHIAGAARSETIGKLVIHRCLYAARTAESPEEVAALFGIAVESCAVEADPAKHRTLIGTTAAQFGFAVEDPSKLVYLPVLFDMLGARDEKLIPALARANATAQTRLLAP
jgi:hypothetical protein